LQKHVGHVHFTAAITPQFVLMQSMATWSAGVQIGSRTGRKCAK